MTLEHYFENERRLNKEQRGKLLYFEAISVARVHNNPYVMIAKTRQMHATNLMENYICWYAIAHPNSENMFCTFNSYSMRNMADYLQDMGVLKGWVDNGSRDLELHNGSVIKCHTTKDMGRPDITLSGKKYGVIVFDEVTINIGYLSSVLHNINHLIIIGNSTHTTYKIWENDESNDKTFHKIALSIKQNYLITPSKCGPHQYRNWVDQINPFKTMERKVIEEKNE